MSRMEFKNKYKDYLLGPAWKKKRALVLARDKKCKISGCKETENLEVHHLWYKNIFNEKLEDLIAICKHHHFIVHHC